MSTIHIRLGKYPSKLSICGEVGVHDRVATIGVVLTYIPLTPGYLDPCYACVTGYDLYTLANLDI